MKVTRERRSFQTLESRTLMAGDVGVVVEPIESNYDSDKWMVADSFSFGVEREMKESGEKGGTEDIALAVGPVQPAAVDEAMATYANDSADSADGGREVYLKYKLDRCFIKSWSISGDADDRPTEEVAFYYNKL